MKTHQRAVRRDSMNEHVHDLETGGVTLGSLGKPSQSTQFPVHTHLYEHEGKTHETGPAQDGPGHTHEVMAEAGAITEGPRAPQAKVSFGPRNDSLMRIGGTWHLRNSEGNTIHVGRTPEDACRRYDASDYDEAMAKRSAGIKDGDELWETAKKHSLDTFGEHKWPYVQHIHKVLGGISV